MFTNSSTLIQNVNKDKNVDASSCSSADFVSKDRIFFGHGHYTNYTNYTKKTTTNNIRTNKNDKNDKKDIKTPNNSPLVNNNNNNNNNNKRAQSTRASMLRRGKSTPPTVGYFKNGVLSSATSTDNEIDSDYSLSNNDN